MFNGFFFTNENPRKFVEKQKDDNFILLHFHVYLDTSKRTITQRTFAPEDFLPRGNFGQENFPPGGFCPRKTLFAKETFLSKKMSTSLEPLFRDICVIKDTLWQSMWSGAEVLTKQKSDTW